MKRRLFLILVVIFLASLTAFSTEQMPDRLIIGKGSWVESVEWRIQHSEILIVKYANPQI